MGSFGAVIPVTGLNLGFLGQVSRLGKRTITARIANNVTNSTAILFGAPVVIVANTNSAGGAYQSVADFINVSSGTFTAALFAGIAVREVKTNLTYSAATPLSMVVAGSYAPGTMAEVLEEGTITVNIPVGTPVSQNPVWVRTVLNGAIPAGIIGDLEAVADGSNTVSLATVGTVFRTGVLDANNTAEVTIRNRVAA
jgi:hypothetical protein